MYKITANKITISNVFDLKLYGYSGISWTGRGRFKNVMCICGNSRSDISIPCPTCGEAGTDFVDVYQTDIPINLTSSEFNILNPTTIECIKKTVKLVEKTASVFALEFNSEVYATIQLDASSVSELFKRSTAYYSSYSSRYSTYYLDSYADIITAVSNVLPAAERFIKLINEFELGSDNISEINYYRLLIRSPRLESFLRELHSLNQDVSGLYILQVLDDFMIQSDLAFNSIDSCIAALKVPDWIADMLKNPGSNRNLWNSFFNGYNSLKKVCIFDCKLKLPYEIQQLIAIYIKDDGAAFSFDGFARLYAVLLREKDLVAAKKFLRKYLVKYNDKTASQLEALIENLNKFGAPVSSSYSYQTLGTLHLNSYAKEVFKRSTADTDTFMAEFESSPLDAIMNCAKVSRKRK